MKHSKSQYVWENLSMKCFALTGGIATGKSTIAHLFKNLGIQVIDADKLAREVVMPSSEGLKLISEKLGTKFIAQDGTLNRQLLAQEIFSNANSRHLLEKITHPLIAELLTQKLAKLRNSGESLAVYEAPLIFETNIQDGFDATILVTCSAEIQLKRLITRDKLSLQEAQKRIKSQMAQDDKKKLADYIIDTSASLESTKAQLKVIFTKAPKTATWLVF